MIDFSLPPVLVTPHRFTLADNLNYMLPAELCPFTIKKILIPDDVGRHFMITQLLLDCRPRWKPSSPVEAVFFRAGAPCPLPTITIHREHLFGIGVVNTYDIPYFFRCVLIGRKN